MTARALAAPSHDPLERRTIFTSVKSPSGLDQFRSSASTFVHPTALHSCEEVLKGKPDTRCHVWSDIDVVSKQQVRILGNPSSYVTVYVQPNRRELIEVNMGDTV